MFIVNNIYRGLLILVNQRVFTGSFPFRKPVSLDAEQDRGAMAVDIKGKTIRNSPW